MDKNPAKTPPNRLPTTSPERVKAKSPEAKARKEEAIRQRDLAREEKEEALATLAL